MRLTTILYASAANLAALTAEVAPARSGGQPIRLIALEEFRGETEQNAGAVYIQVPEAASEERERFSVLFDAIAQAYPHLNVREYETGAFDVREEEDTHHMIAADDALRDLRMSLIAAGGSAPANADAETLSNLIAAQRATQGLGSRTPVMPTPATQGTVIPDSTPVVQRQGADALVSESATGTSQEALQLAQGEAGPGSGQTDAGAASPPQEGGATGVATGSDHSTFSPAQQQDLSKVTTHKQAQAIADAEGVDLAGKQTVDDKVAAIKAARDAKAGE